MPGWEEMLLLPSPNPILLLLLPSLKRSLLPSPEPSLLPPSPNPMLLPFRDRFFCRFLLTSRSCSRVPRAAPGKPARRRRRSRRGRRRGSRASGEGGGRRRGVVRASVATERRRSQTSDSTRHLSERAAERREGSTRAIDTSDRSRAIDTSDRMRSIDTSERSRAIDRDRRTRVPRATLASRRPPERRAPSS